MLSLYVFQEMAISDVLPRIRTHFGAVGIHKLRWQYFAHYWSPTRTLLTFAKKCFTEIMENLQSVEISSTTYLPYLFTIVSERPHLVENATEQKRGTPAKVFQKVIRDISEYVAYKRKCPTSFLFVGWGRSEGSEWYQIGSKWEFDI